MPMPLKSATHRSYTYIQCLTLVEASAHWVTVGHRAYWQACLHERQVTALFHILNGIRICEKAVSFDNIRNGISQKILISKILWRGEAFIHGERCIFVLKFGGSQCMDTATHCRRQSPLPPRRRCTTSSSLYHTEQTCTSCFLSYPLCYCSPHVLSSTTSQETPPCPVWTEE